MSDLKGPGPDPEAIVTHIRDTYPDTAILESGGTWFFSLDAERHFPNFATIVTNDDFDEGSNLSRPGVFRLNIGVDRATFGRLVGHVQAPDFAALNRFLPHPTYARQHWISILNPNASRFDAEVKPLIALAHDRLASARARHAR
jgi:hypothetical protein